MIIIIRLFVRNLTPLKFLQLGQVSPLSPKISLWNTDIDLTKKKLGGKFAKLALGRNKNNIIIMWKQQQDQRLVNYHKYYKIANAV